jgi:Domain of unknown function (DUF5666)
MRFPLFASVGLGLALAVAATAQDPGNSGPQGQQAPGAGMGRGQGGRGFGGFMGGRGMGGTVTEAGTDHYTIKTELGETYIVHFSVNTRIVKQPPQRTTEEGMRTPPQEIKSSDIRVGDVIMAGGEVDAAAKSVGAVMVMKIDPERAKQIREMQANFGKTWLAGKVTAVNETKITLLSQFDNADHAFVADENTSFRKRREPITLADVQVGDNVRAEGAIKDGTFTATAVTVMGPPASGGPARREGPPPQ